MASGAPMNDSEIFLIPLYFHYSIYAQAIKAQLPETVIHDMDNEGLKFWYDI
jgi:hypothetical protein